MPDKLTPARLELLGRSYSRRNTTPAAPSVRTVRGSPPPNNRLSNGALSTLTSSPSGSPRSRRDSLELTRRRGISLCDSSPSPGRRRPSPSPPQSIRHPQPATPPRSILRNGGRQGNNTANELLLVSSSTLKEFEPVAKPKTPTGLCVICQDNEAIMAAVDCGHLAMCKECSQGVMKSSRACPLCRKRIEETRLIRIFKT
ncbi:hypothetical protein C8R45DRAFT_387620 [Mycena sanguinolenta]|nr:hypothetical protein C8R45DRAFT_387620 [Mycena sanguinolenta]